ncbi:MAG TPA: tRNA threonylcarbamoyladenosine dehydratase [Syntrophomonas sp.]|nr:tRNA threonylcarbamoyladenosine dehydratase [Syntrophomonas sp.]
MINEFSRTELLIGKEALVKLAKSHVAIFGIGGVGSYAVEALARSGVGKLTLVDHDEVSLTNINRQILATHKTLGQPKVEVMRERILDINPQAEVEIHQRFYMPGEADDILDGAYDYIIDAIDTVTAKIDLIVQAQQRGIPVISSMGAGNKLDPSRFEIDDLYNTSVCPLAKVMRRELRQRGVASLKVVYSREEPIKQRENKESASDRDCESCIKSEACSGKRRVPGSIAFVPSVAGLLLAGEVVKDLIKPI